MEHERYTKLVEYWILSDKPLSELKEALELMTRLEYILFKTKGYKRCIIIDNGIPEAMNRLGVAVDKAGKELSIAFKKLNKAFDNIEYNRPKKSYSKFDTHYSRTKG